MGCSLMARHLTVNQVDGGSSPPVPADIRPIRLMVRTPGFQPGNRSSILLSASGAVVQLGERLPCTEEVAGSSPVSST